MGNDYSIYRTVRRICDICDGVMQCDYLDNNEICILLTALCIVYLKALPYYCLLTI